MLALTLTASISATAHAEEAGAEAPTSTPHWYGYQTLASDGIAVGIGLAGLSTTGNARIGLAGVGLASYGLGAPVIHLLRQNPGKAAGDLALRLLTPVATGVTAQLLVQHTTVSATTRDRVGVYAGAAGAVIAMAIDAAVLAREDVRPQFEVPRAIAKKTEKKTEAVILEPNVDFPKGGVSAGVHGVF